MKSLIGIEDQLKTLSGGRKYHPSPAAWEDQIFYFLMLDRFSDGQEKDYKDNNGNISTGGSTPPFDHSVAGQANITSWEHAGERFCGGTLNGLRSKLGYLKRLGVTAIWISPVFKQIQAFETYHGYGIQDFLDIDPRFGTRDDLKDLVSEAHGMNIYVILDIILNHSGDVFDYEQGNCPWDQSRIYPVKGFRDAKGNPGLPFTPDSSRGPDDAIWPAELQEPDAFSRKGYIKNWDNFPEYLEGDFLSLKDIHLGDDEPSADHDRFKPSKTLRHLADCYRYWMAYADIDGFRIDTVKHMAVGATRHFASVIHEYAQTLGKDRFHLIGEITGDRANAFNTVEATGLNSALGIANVQEKMEGAAKGTCDPGEYFALFRNSEEVGRGTHTWFRNRVVTMFDDHDQVRRGEHKARFASWGEGRALVLNALSLNLLTLGIPCIYYGSEQMFDGNGFHDKYLRESMFGGNFGAFKSQNRHFFDETGPVFRELPKIIAIRNRYLALRRGRQYFREISGNGSDFGYPYKISSEPIRSVVAWSRIHSNEEILVAINTDPHHDTSAWVTVDIRFMGKWECLYPLDNPNVAGELSTENRNGAALPLTVPAAGLVIYRKIS